MSGLRRISLCTSIIIIFTMLLLATGNIIVAAETNYALDMRWNLMGIRIMLTLAELTY